MFRIIGKHGGGDTGVPSLEFRGSDPKKANTLLSLKNLDEISSLVKFIRKLSVADKKVVIAIGERRNSGYSVQRPIIVRVRKRRLYRAPFRPNSPLARVNYASLGEIRSVLEFSRIMRSRLVRLRSSEKPRLTLRNTFP